MAAQTVPSVSIRGFGSLTFHHADERATIQQLQEDIVKLRNTVDALVTDYLIHTHKSAGATSQTSIAGTDTAGTTTTTPSTVTGPSSTLSIT